jgi:protein SCO1
MTRKIIIVLISGLIAVITIYSIENSRPKMEHHHHEGMMMSDDHFQMHKEEPNRIAPVFSLIDQSGRVFSSIDLQGKIWLFNLFYSSCPSICPVVSPELQALLAEFPELHVVSVTVDPDTDTFEQIESYAKKYNADPARWHIVRGELDRVKEISVQGFGMGVSDNPMEHSLSIAIVDRHGFIRGYFRGTEKDKVQELKVLLHKLFAHTPE